MFKHPDLSLDILPDRSFSISKGKQQDLSRERPLFESNRGTTAVTPRGIPIKLSQFSPPLVVEEALPGDQSGREITRKTH